MSDGGRSAAWGFLFQYLRTLEALLDAVDLNSIRAVYVEGRVAGTGDRPAESVDYELVDHAGITVAAVQVKRRSPDGFLGPAEVFRALSGLARDRDALRYELITNARLGESAALLAEILRSEAGPGELRRRIGEVLSTVGAGHAKAELLRMGEEEVARLGRGVVTVDPREDAEVHAALRTRLRRYRNDHRKGLGDASAGLLAGYLLSEIFAGAAYEGRAELSVAAFRSWLLADSATLQAAVSRRDWGVIVGPVPGWPDIHRGSLIDQIAKALPCRGEQTSVRRCLLAGLSGIGKSSLAAAFIMDRADLYDVIYWADAESDGALAGSFARILAHLAGAGGVAVADAARVRDRVHEALARSAGRWLMVLDNCTDLRTAEPWIPRAGNGHVIVTATDDAAPPGSAAKITVGPMSDTEAIALVRTRLAATEIPQKDAALISQLAHAMERWPLALELAAAYITAGGMGAAGIPRYLATVKMRSLDHSRAVPPGYPRTLVEAIFLCLERIESQSERDSDPAGVAASAVWFAAYLSSRRIPVHLLITAVMMDPQSAGGMQAVGPCYMSPSVCPDPEVISLLRSESLVSVDEPLPAEGLTDCSVPDATVSVNSVLQEVLRYRRDADPRVPEHILGRLAYHVALWLAASHGAADHPRTLIFGAHAATIHEHAVRLGADSDCLALMRGNLAPVLLRRGDIAQATALLRAEIAQVEHKPAEHCVLLCCQAQIMLASVLAEDEPPGYAEIIRLLGSAFVTLQARAADKPTGVARLVLSIQGTLRRVIPQRWGPDGKLMHDMSQLEAVVTDLLDRLPETHASSALQVLEDAETAFRSRRPKITIEKCREALRRIVRTASEDPMAHQVEPQARRLLIEALIDSGDMPAASRELGVFWAVTEPAELHAAMREQLLHNAGQALALKWLTSDEPLPAVTELLASMVTPDLTEPLEAVFPGRTAARIRLLRAVSALASHDEPSASAHLETALLGLQSEGDQSGRNAGWLLVARLTQSALSEHRKLTSDRDKQPTPAGTMTAGSSAQAPEPSDRAASRNRASFPRRFQRRIAPALLAQGLPGPAGTWIRRPRPGEHHAISDLLDAAGDELAPWAADAINNCTLSSALVGMLTDRPLEELATELHQGGMETLMSGLTIVLVATTPDRQLIGAIQAAPPFQLLDELGHQGIAAAQLRAGAAIIAKISGVAVEPSHRSTGIGKALTSSAQDLCWRLGRQLVYGQSPADPRLSRFFASCGFSICDRLTAIDLAPYGVPAVITPQPGNQFFASHFDLIPGENKPDK